MSKNTKLGRALDDACSELDHLGKLVSDISFQSQSNAFLSTAEPRPIAGFDIMLYRSSFEPQNEDVAIRSDRHSLVAKEKESLLKATELLRKLGYKGDLSSPETASTSPDGD